MTETPSTSSRTDWAQIGAVLAAIGASLCCVAPLVLLSIGVGGAWVGSLSALAPYRPIFIVATLALLGFTGWRLYRREDDCAPGEVCVNPAVKRRQRLIFWLVALPLLALLAFPWYAPALL